MDAKLVEEITRLVLSKLEEYSNPTVCSNGALEYSPLTEEELNEWHEISSTIRFPKSGNEVSTYLVPLTSEELNTWKDISVRIGFGGIGKVNVEEQPEYLPLTDKELKSWGDLGKEKSVLPKREPGHGRVKFYSHQ